MKKRLVVANWKMYVKSPEAAKAFVRGLRRKSRQFAGVSVAVAPAFPLLPIVGAALKGASTVHLAAQSVTAYADEAHTGEVSAAMLKHAGTSFVIVGHSERRTMGETDEMIKTELAFAQEEGLVPILCVGEKTRDEAGSHFAEIESQLTSALTSKSGKRLVVAYEPVWAIGAAQAMNPAELQETIIFIRKVLADILGRPAALKTAILYGGSVDGDNTPALLKEGGVAGFLVGRASAELETFMPILHACRK